jgi:hypothetical protein
MRFASLQSSGNGAKYAAAGKAVADSSANIFDVQRKTGPDYAGLSKVAMKTAAEEKIAGMKAEATVAQAGIKAVAGMKQAQIKTEVFKRGEEIKNKQRKAGGLAAIGKIAGAGFLAATDNTKGRERPKSGLKGLLDTYTSDMAGLKDRQQSEFDALGPYKPTKPGSTGGTDSGKVTGGGTASQGAGNIQPSQTGQAYMKMLTSSGMSKQQAAAMVGHLKVESDNFQADTEYAPNAYGTKGRGHLQWTDTGNSGGRRTNFEAFATKNDLSPTSFEANSQFLLSELQGNHGNHWSNGGSYQGFLQTSNINDASSYLQNNYIRPGVPHTERRLQGAHSAFNAFQ